MKRGLAPVRALLFAAARTLSRASRLLSSAAAATLDHEGLRAGVEPTWREYSQTEEMIASGLNATERAVILPRVRRGDRVLLVGCGAGRDLIPLLEVGCEAVGVEPIASVLDVARSALAARGLHATLVEGFFLDVRLDGRFDAVIFSNYCFSAIPQSRRRVEALVKASRHLHPEGSIVVSYLTRSEGWKERLLPLMRRVARLSGSDWEPEPGDRVTPLDDGSARVLYEHHFAAGELEREGREAGLEVAFTTPIGHDTPMLVFRRRPPS